jgi:hypothetical protein
MKCTALIRCKSLREIDLVTVRVTVVLTSMEMATINSNLGSNEYGSSIGDGHTINETNDDKTMKMIH